jgi:hypothetical protein
VILVGVEVREVRNDPIPILVCSYVPTLIAFAVQSLLSEELNVVNRFPLCLSFDIIANVPFLVVIESCL